MSRVRTCRPRAQRISHAVSQFDYRPLQTLLADCGTPQKQARRAGTVLFTPDELDTNEITRRTAKLKSFVRRQERIAAFGRGGVLRGKTPPRSCLLSPRDAMMAG